MKPTLPTRLSRGLLPAAVIVALCVLLFALIPVQAQNGQDRDGDGLPDAWETAHGLNARSAAGINGATGDPDHDGLSNIDEWANGTDPQRADTDGDGLPDLWEVENLTDPLRPDGINGPNGDPDEDGLINRDEMLRGTDPHNTDSDGDGLLDGWEVVKGIKPNDNRGINGANGDGNGDGETNLAEFLRLNEDYSPPMPVPPVSPPGERR